MPVRFTFDARLECVYLADEPVEEAAPPYAVFTLHGYGMTPETMLTLTRMLVGPRPLILALQAPHAFYAQGPERQEVGFSWATHVTSESAVRLHHEMLLTVFEQVRERWGVGADRRVLAGFSQPVGPNYRFAATHPGAVRGAIGICGGVPRDWEDNPRYRPVSAALLHIAREQDEVYPAAKARDFARRLRLRAPDVEFHMIEGRHRFPSKAGPLAAAWLARLFPETAPPAER